MPHAEINVPGLILVGRFSGDHHWPVLGDRWGLVLKMEIAITDTSFRAEVIKGIVVGAAPVPNEAMGREVVAFLAHLRTLVYAAIKGSDC